MNLQQSFSSLSCHNVFISQEGEVMAWGENSSGSCGVGHNSTFIEPQRVKVPEGVEVVMVAGGM
jgi:alpha-tubulin suppressor-like RCC1 family protein